MIYDLLVVHRARRTKAEDRGLASKDLLLPSPWINWQTCLRQISIGLENWYDGEFVPGDEIFRGKDAYRFLLAVICGLHSPIVGETEVLGQFRKLFSELELHGYFDSSPLHNVFEKLFEDVKEIRSSYLSNLGSQTYGSVARAFLEGINSVSILGSGQLAEEILPWLFEESRIVSLFYRSLVPAVKLKRNHPALMIYDLYCDHKAPLGDALIIAAPVSNMVVQDLVARRNEPVKVLLDLRAKGKADPLCIAEREIALGEFFSVLNETQLKVQNKVREAKQAIDACVNARASEIVLRPFGWEDAWR